MQYIYIYIFFEVGVHLNPLNKVYRRPWLRHRSPSLTGSDVRHMSNTDTLPKMACWCNVAQNFFVFFLSIMFRCKPSYYSYEPLNMNIFLQTINIHWIRIKQFNPKSKLHRHEHKYIYDTGTDTRVRQLNN